MGAIKDAAIQKSEPQAPAKAKDPVRALVEAMAPAIQRALPKHMDSERFARIAITAIRSTPALGECLNTPEGKMSLLGALMQSAQLGLEPGVLGSCYILPFRKSYKDARGQWHKRMEAQFILGYRGMIDLARRSGAIQTLYANEVCENDSFEMSYGVGGVLRHTPNLRGDRGEVIGYYAFAQLDGDGAYQYLYWPKTEVEKHGKTHSETWGKDWSPWTKHFDAMARKTLIRQIFNILPVSIELLRMSIAADEKVLRANVDGDRVTIDIEDAEFEEPPTAQLVQAEPEPEPAPEPELPHTGPSLTLKNSGINTRTLNALVSKGVRTVDDVYAITQGLVGDDAVAELAKLDDVGPKGAKEVVEFCHNCDLSLESESVQEAQELYRAGKQGLVAQRMKEFTPAERATFVHWASEQADTKQLATGEEE